MTRYNKKDGFKFEWPSAKDQSFGSKVVDVLVLVAVIITVIMLLLPLFAILAMPAAALYWLVLK